MTRNMQSANIWWYHWLNIHIPRDKFVLIARNVFLQIARNAQRALVIVALSVSAMCKIS
jgi:hypothetical protein